jgi:tetratricopeptide (TPR) repeat protein/2-polyprenyl-3-methyl-5-hydroxy-6-metoxy-1,4-benzoquinol methylase
METLKIDNKEYDLDALSDECKVQLTSIQFVEQELARLQAKAAALQTAKAAYLQALKSSLSVFGEGVTDSPKNLTNLNQTRNPSQIELNTLLKYYQKGQYDLAQNLATILTQQYPNHPFGWQLLCAVFKQTGRLQDSLITNQKVLEITPNDAAAHSNLGNTLKELGRLEEAEVSYKKAIAIKSDFAEAHSNLGNTLRELGRLEEAEISCRKAIAIKPDLAEANVNLGSTLKELGKLQEAETSYKRAIAIKPDFAQAHSNLGNTLRELGRLEDAEISYKKAIVIKPDFAEAHSNLGSTLQELGRLKDAETSYKKAIAIKSELAEAHSNLGVTLQELGRLQEAETSYKKAIAIKPDFAQAHSNLGNTLKELGRLEEAEISCRKAIAIKPDYAEAHSNLGVTLQELGRLQEAETSYKKAIVIKPSFAEAHSNLGTTLKELDRLEDAFNAVIKSIRIKPTVEAKNLFIAISQKINIKAWDHSLSQLALTALLEPWGRPSDVMPFAMKLLSKNEEFSKVLNQSNSDIDVVQLDESLLSSILVKEFDCSPLMQAMLTSTPIADTQFEKVFTNLRAYLLKVASSLKLKEDKSDDVVALYCSLALQCFINEYVFFQTTDEIDKSQILRDLLKKALEEDQSIPSAWIIAVACYFPLHSIEGAKKLLGKKYSKNIHNVLVQQIQEPLEELHLRRSIPSLTSIENQVSLKVQSQYEENPYPRWTRLPKASSKKHFNSYIQSKFPYAGFKRLGEDKNLEILIAGCGTGQHSIGTSQLIKGAKILAVDLSMVSLGYAKRKTAELDIDAIEYAQADLLKLNSLGRTFDVIESSGVLHHLENPFDGWEVLLSLLRPYGLMKLGFYSELARRDIVRVRNLISSAGIGSSLQEIRDYRRHLLRLKSSEDYGFATGSADFFSTSSCRDLLFHVQEHRMNLRTLDRFFKDHDLNFLGFEIDSSVIQAYKKRFANDKSATNLNQWHIYEEENPDTFIGMYQFYVQKNA